MNVNEKKQALDLQATITAQSKTIERLADALEVALSFDERTNQEENVWSMYALALLAEIRGAK